MERFLDHTILPIVLVYFLLVVAFIVMGVLLIVKVRRERDLWDDNL